MAYYDSRYSSRRRDPYHSSSTSDSNGYSSRSGRGYEQTYYEPRSTGYAFTPPREPRPKRSSVNPSGQDRLRRSWPPNPIVEDEVEALAKEIPSGLSLEDDSGEEVQSRGAIDQQPIIEDSEPRDYDKRFVWVSDSKNGNYAESRSRDRRKSFAERANMAPLDTDVNDPPVFTKRTPTPYAYSKPSVKESITPSAPAYYLSPEPITPSTSTIPRSMPRSDPRDSRIDQNAKPAKTTHRRHDSGKYSPRQGKYDTFDGSDIDSDDAGRLRAERKPARYSFVNNQGQKEDLRTNLQNAKREDKEPRTPSGATKSGRDRSNSSASSRHSTPPTPSRSSTPSLYDEVTSRQRYPAREDSRASTRPVSRQSSPLPREERAPPVPPRVPPKVPLHDRRQGPPSPSYRPASPEWRERPPSPGPPSRRDSKPSSPTRYHVPRQTRVSDADWHSTYPPASQDDGPRPPARFGRHETAPPQVPPRIGVQSPSPARPPQNANPLPYPMDDRPRAFMPAEEKYQVPAPISIPSRVPTYEMPYPESPRMPSSPIIGSSNDRSSYVESPVSSRYPPVDDPYRPRTSRPGSAAPRTANDVYRDETPMIELSVERALPTCHRREATDKYNDWYGLENCPNFDICPSCYEGAFAHTRFAPFFKQSRRYDVPVFRYCDFYSPWMRLAWLLTIKHKRERPDLLYALATLLDDSEVKPCPEEKEVAGTWYGIRDPRDGRFVDNFHVCHCDLIRVETLFPTLRGYFTRMPPDPWDDKGHRCAFRITSKRFGTYLDHLVAIDGEAQEKGGAPDFDSFLELVRENAYKRECSKGQVRYQDVWHFIPSIPELTVCEECYEEVVWPEIEKGSRLASMFNRTLQLLPREVEGSGGASCCLYSKRMRRVWEKAVAREDFNGLKVEANERKKAMGRLGREKAELLAMIEQTSFEYADADRRETFRRALKAVESEMDSWE